MAGWWSRNILRVYAVLALCYLLLPVAYTLAFSFNDAGRSNLIWKGFTLRAWKGICDAPDVCSAVGNSLLVGLLATAVATVLPSETDIFLESLLTLFDNAFNNA